MKSGDSGYDYSHRIEASEHAWTARKKDGMGRGLMSALGEKLSGLLPRAAHELWILALKSHKVQSGSVTAHSLVAFMKH